MRVLVVGSGGREHALAWKLSGGPSVDELHAAPGNPGIAELGTCHPVRAEDAEGVLALARELAVDLVVIGPEAPLVAGVADDLRHAGISVFGPGRAAARIEGSKIFAKEVMGAAGVPTAAVLNEARAPCVVKVDGLAAGKGVFVCTNQGEVHAAMRAAAALGGQVLVEELLEGDELSLLTICAGREAVALPAARDSKRLEDGNRGPNTGGMGAFAPVPGIDEGGVEELLERIHRPTLRELAARGTPFVGILYAGLMLTGDGTRVLEFNCRFGDPETQSILPLLDGDVAPALAAAASGELEGVRLRATGESAVTVVLAAGEYPRKGDVGTPIEGVHRARESGALVFHAGTAGGGNALVTNGGRILDVTATGPTLSEARQRAYRAADLASFAGMRLRRDLGDIGAVGSSVTMADVVGG